MEFLQLYLVSFVSFIALDSVWLGVVAPKFYKAHIGHLMAKDANFFAAGLFYALFMAGLVFFVVQPAVRESSLQIALTRGAFFGLVAYATFDLTSQAVLKDWPWLVTGVDLLWGAFITGAVSGVSYLIFTRLFS